MSGELGQREWKVLDFREGAVEDNPKGGGQLQKFYVDFEGSPDVYWRRKLPATIEKGNAYFGTISKGTYGPIFKKESPGQGGHAEASAGTGKREWKPESQYDPEKTARIGRAHAQEMAVRTLTAMGSLQTKSASDLHRLLKEWTSFFETDVNDAGQAANQAQGALKSDGAGTSPPSASPESGSPPAEEHRDIEMALSSADLAQSLSTPGRTKVAEYMLAELTDEDRDRACNQLTNSADQFTQGQIVRAMIQRTERWVGGPLPAAPEDDSSVPF